MINKQARSGSAWQGKGKTMKFIEIKKQCQSEYATSDKLVAHKQRYWPKP